VTTEHDGTPGHGATPEAAGDGDDPADGAADAQPAMADSAATASAVPGRARPVTG
jgi:hypothetical protein